MTVLTKPFSAIQAKKPEDHAPKDDEKLMKSGVEAEVKIEGVPEDREETEYFLVRASRIARMTNFCMLLSLLSLLLLGIGAGIHSYRVFVFRNSWAGRCSLPLRDFFSENTIIGASIKRREQNNEAYKNLMSMDDRRTKSVLPIIPDFQDSFEFDYDVDVEEQNYEVVELPEIFFGRYMHDFKANLTVIIDSMRERCYIFKLDRALIPAPRNLFDIIVKMKQGVYDVNMQEIQKNYRIVGDELESLEGLGYLVPRSCSNKRTFRLEEMVGDVIEKREAVEDKMEQFGEFTGHAVIQYHIVN